MPWWYLILFAAWQFLLRDILRRTVLWKVMFSDNVILCSSNIDQKIDCLLFLIAWPDFSWFISKAVVMMIRIDYQSSIFGDMMMMAIMSIKEIMIMMIRIKMAIMKMMKMMMTMIRMKMAIIESMSDRSDISNHRVPTNKLLHFCKSYHICPIGI